MAPTMEDVARLAGVSKSTVSLVLNRKPGVSLELRRAVEQAAAQLGYRLKSRPRRLNRARTLAVVYGHGGQPTGIYLGYLDGIRAFTQQAKINVVLIASEDQEDAEELGAHLLRGEGMAPDGVLFMGVERDNPLLALAEERGYPIVVLSRYWPDRKMSFVTQDHHEQANLAIEHLIGLGHRRIAFLARERDQRYEWFRIRLECYKEALKRHGWDVELDLIALAPDGAEAAKQLVARRPDVTAIFAVYDARAIEAMKGLKEVGWRVPEDISVIAVDDTKQPPEGFPLLTTVGFSQFDLGYLGAEVLVKQIENREISHSYMVVRSRLIERESCTEPRSG